MVGRALCPQPLHSGVLGFGAVGFGAAGFGVVGFGVVGFGVVGFIAFAPAEVEVVAADVAALGGPPAVTGRAGGLNVS